MVSTSHLHRSCRNPPRFIITIVISQTSLSLTIRLSDHKHRIYQETHASLHSYFDPRRKWQRFSQGPRKSVSYIADYILRFTPPVQKTSISFKKNHSIIEHRRREGGTPNKALNTLHTVRRHSEPLTPRCVYIRICYSFNFLPIPRASSTLSR